MTDISVEFDGLQSTARKLKELKEDYDGDGITYVAGTNVEYALYLERGTQHMPAYPWFKPAIREFKRDPEGFIRDTSAYSSVDEIPSTEALVKAVSFGLVNRMKDNVNAQKGVDRSPGTNPEHPKRDTGNLTASISAVRIS